MSDVQIRITIDSSGAVRGSNQARRAFQNLDEKIQQSDIKGGKFKSTLSQISKSTRLIRGPLDGAASRFQTLNAIVNESNLGLVVLGGTIATVSLGFAKFVSYASQYQTLSNKIKLVTDSTQELNDVSKELFNITQRTRGDLKATFEIYSKYDRYLQDLGMSQKTLFDLTEATNLAVALSQTTTQSAAAALFQFSQGLAAGQLRGQELNSVIEQTPLLAQAIAEGMGVALGSLRESAKQGKLTAGVISDALISQLPNLRKEFEKTEITLSQALGKIGNALLFTSGKADETVGFTQSLSNALSDLADVISSDATKEFIKFLGFMAAVPLVLKMVRAVKNLKTATVSLSVAMAALNALSPFGWVTLAAAGLYGLHSVLEDVNIELGKMMAGKDMKVGEGAIREEIDQLNGKLLEAQHKMRTFRTEVGRAFQAKEVEEYKKQIQGLRDVLDRMRPYNIKTYEKEFLFPPTPSKFDPVKKGEEFQKSFNSFIKDLDKSEIEKLTFGMDQYEKKLFEIKRFVDSNPNFISKLTKNEKEQLDKLIENTGALAAKQKELKDRKAQEKLEDIPTSTPDFDPLLVLKQYIERASILEASLATTFSRVSENVTDALVRPLQEGESALDRFKNFVSDTMRQIAADILRQQISARIAQAALSFLGGGSPFALAGGTFGQKAQTPVQIPFKPVPSAKGNIFSAPIGNPLAFPIRNGVGTMSEGGRNNPEAIMPLARDSSGRLGIRSQGGRGSYQENNVNINIYNQGGSTSESGNQNLANKVGKEVQKALSIQINKEYRNQSRPGGLLNSNIQV